MGSGAFNCEPVAEIGCCNGSEREWDMQIKCFLLALELALT